MMDYLNYILLPFLLLGFALFVPGFLLASIADARAGVVKNLAVAPAISFTLITIGTLVMRYLPLRWGMFSYLLLTVVAALLVWLGKLSLRGLSLKRNATDSVTENIKTERTVVSPKSLLLTVFTWLALISVLVMQVDFSRVIQGGDSNYHYNQLVLISQTGNIHPLNANAGLGGLDPAGWFYPTTWHAFVTLGTQTGGTIISAVAAFLLLMPMVWLLTVSVMTVNITQDKRTWVWAGIAALVVPLATIRLELLTTLWPFYTTIVVVPGVISLALEKRPLSSFTAGHMNLWQWAKHYSVRLFIAGLLLLGLAGLHPSVVVVPGVALVAVIAAALAQRAVNLIKQGQKSKGYIQALLAGAVVLLFVGIIYAPGPHQSQLHRYPDVGWSNILVKLITGTGVFVPAPYLIGYALAFVVLGLGCVGVWRLYRAGKFLLSAGVVSQWLILMGTLFPIPVFSKLTSFYYNVPDRAKVAYAILLVPLLVVAMQWLWNRLPIVVKRFQPTLVVALTLCLVAVNAPGISSDIADSFYPQKGSVRFLADDRELALIARTADTLQDTDLVLGDPAIGVSLIYTMTGKNVVWKYPAVTQDKEDDWYLVRNFYNYKHDPRVCEIVRKYKITHFYKDVSTFFNGSYTWKLRPGMYGVDTNNPGFELVDEGSTAKLYRFTYCEQNR